MSIKRVVLANRCYHLVSRIAHRAFFLDAEEKCRFVELMKRAAAFSGVRLLGWCVMSNHFHIFIYLPDEQPLTDMELRMRLEDLYRGPQLARALAEWDDFKMEADAEIAAGVTSGSRFEDLKNRLRRRMFHPGEFMRTLKQYVTTSFNGRRTHYGTLWETRYRVRMSKPLVKDMSEQLAYVDCNPFEAGMCKNPADYEWSGWHAALRGDETARAMYRFVYCGEAFRQGKAESDMSWDDIVAVHEQAIRNRIGEISESRAIGEEVDWMFSKGVGATERKSRMGGDLVCLAGPELHLPKKRSIHLERGKGDTAERILEAVKAVGELSAGDILEAVGLSSRSFLLSAYLKPMVERGYLSLALPDKPSSRYQKYRPSANVSEQSA